MKKMSFMRMAALMLLLCLASTCAISGTFAKYTTSGEATDVARVAKWGVTVSASAMNVFDKTYDGSGDLSVDSSTAEDVVAPGTDGALAGFSIAGTPEVAVQVTYTAVLSLTGWEVGGDYYCPIVITVGTEEFNGLDYASAAEFKDDVEEAIAGYSAQYAPNTSLAGTAAPVVEWEWPFTGDDAKDTALGNAGGAISLKVAVTIDQLDTYPAP